MPEVILELASDWVEGDLTGYVKHEAFKMGEVVIPGSWVSSSKPKGVLSSSV